MSESGPPDATGGRGETARSGDQGTPGRGTLSRETIVTAAIDFVDRNGLPVLTMRRLGEYLGVEAMSLYRYVNGREDLLEGIVRRMVDDLHIDPRRRELLAGNGWQAYLQWLAHAVRRLARQHPQIFPLIATRHPAAPWLRPPLRSLEVVEDFLATLTDRGFSVENAVTAYRTFTSYLLGYLLLEVATLSGRALTTEEPINEGDADVPNTQEVSLDGFPHIQRMEPLLSQDHTDAEFEQSLEDLLDRLDRLVSR